MEAICTAKFKAICLLVAAAPSEAGSWCWVRAAISGLVAVSLHRTLFRPTDPVFLSRARKIRALVIASISPAAFALVKAWSATSC
jgi:hypothetical protein